MNTLEVYYSTKEQLAFINACLSKGPTRQDTITFMEQLHINGYSPFLMGEHSVKFWDMNIHTRQESENTIVSAINCFTFLTIIKREN